MLKREGVEIDRAAMDAVAQRLGFNLPEGDAEAVVVLRKRFAKRCDGIDPKDWIECQACLEVTDDSDEIECCPFCGDEGGDAVEIGDIGSASEPEEPPTVDLDDETTPAPEEPVELSEPVEAGAALTSEEASSDMAVALEREKLAIEKAQRGIVGGTYDLGLALKRIKDGDLWKAEGHKTFTQFLMAQNMSRTFAYDMIEIVTKFDRQTFSDIGRRKLSVIARSAKDDPEKEAALLDAAGTRSARDLESSVTGTGAGKRRKSSGAAPPPENRESETAPPAEDKITLLGKVGAKPTSVRWKKRQTGEEVSEWAPDAYAEVEISEDVVQFVALKTDSKGTITGLSVVYRRRGDVAPKTALMKVSSGPKKASVKKASVKKAPAKKKAVKKAAKKVGPRKSTTGA
jgi:hypothetical protein